MKKFEALVEDAVPTNTVGATPPPSMDNSVVAPKNTFKVLKRKLKVSGVGFVEPSNASGATISESEDTHVAAIRGKEHEVYGKPLHEVDNEVRSMLKGDDNHAYKLANEHTTNHLGKEMPRTHELNTSTREVQEPIALAFSHGVNATPEYKRHVFNAYKFHRPDIVNELGASDYDDLVHKSYKSLATHIEHQYSKLPVKLHYHGGGEGRDYHNSMEMVRDVHKHKNLNVFKGGDEHPLLKDVDHNGVSLNEKFRAVHDYFGHAIHGNPFGAKGEEIAWETHKHMFPVGALPALSSETRGQNSWVNYSGANDHVIEKMKSIRNDKHEQLKKNPNFDTSKHDEQLRHVGVFEWNYAPQVGVALPPQMLEHTYNGEHPPYLKGKSMIKKFDSENKPIHEGLQGGSRRGSRGGSYYFDDEDSGYFDNQKTVTEDKAEDEDEQKIVKRAGGYGYGFSFADMINQSVSGGGSDVGGSGGDGGGGDGGGGGGA